MGDDVGAGPSLAQRGNSQLVVGKGLNGGQEHVRFPAEAGQVRVKACRVDHFASLPTGRVPDHRSGPPFHIQIVWTETGGAAEGI